MWHVLFDKHGLSKSIISIVNKSTVSGPYVHDKNRSPSSAAQRRPKALSFTRLFLLTLISVDIEFNPGHASSNSSHPRSYFTKYPLTTSALIASQYSLQKSNDRYCTDRDLGYSSGLLPLLLLLFQILIWCQASKRQMSPSFRLTRWVAYLFTSNPN